MNVPRVSTAVSSRLSDSNGPHDSSAVENETADVGIDPGSDWAADQLAVNYK